MDGFQDKKTRYYVNGMLIEASDDYRYQAFDENNDALGVIDPSDLDTNDIAVANGTIEAKELEAGHHVVSNSGSIVKDKKYVKDADGNYYAVDKDGNVLFVSADNEYASKIASCWSKSGITGKYNVNDDNEVTGWTCE